MPERNPRDQSVHDQWVQAIAKKRMAFPNADHPHWRTYLNEPGQTMGVTDGQTTVYPDIVVVDTRSNAVVMLGEVETASSVAPTEVGQWKQYGGMTDAFYLYVPEGAEEAARQLAGAARLAGLRTYGVDGQRNIRITNL